jgi:DHA3 family macrolide efflux protein-like MFS transporter
MASQLEQRHPSNWKRTFFTIWTGQKFSTIGSAVAGFALVWWLTESTGSATVLAFGTLVTMLPGILLGPFAGALVDRWNRRAVMIVADSAIALFSAWLVYLFWSGALQMWHVYVIMAARAIGGTFHDPAMTASTPLMVPEKHLARVQGLNSALSGAVSIIAPPLGALLVGLLPLHGIMAIDVISAAFAIVPLFFVGIPQPKRRAAPVTQGSKPSLWNDVREGVRYLWHWRGLRGLLVMMLVAKFALVPALSLTPVLVTKHFGRGVAQLGWLNSAWGLGLILGGLTLGAWGGFRRRIVTSLLGLIGLGAGTLLIGLLPTTAFGLALGAMFVVGFMASFSDGPLVAILQTVVPPEMQGRVFTVIISVGGVTAPLGMALAGPLSDRLGIHTWFIMCGVACVSMAVYGFLTPVVMHIEENHNQRDPKEERVLASVTAQASASAE